MKDIETVVSDNIKKLLKEYNINQNDLAKITDVSESTVGKWVLKKATPRMGAIQKISDYFDLPKSYILEEKERTFMSLVKDYPYLPEPISAGLPNAVDGITETDIISIPDTLMGKHAGNNQIYVTRVNGESMNNVMPNESIIAVKPINLEDLKNGDIVVYKHNQEYAVKRFYKNGDTLIFRPDSSEEYFADNVIDVNDPGDLRIKGKVVMHSVLHD